MYLRVHCSGLNHPYLGNCFMRVPFWSDSVLQLRVDLIGIGLVRVGLVLDLVIV